MAQHRRHPPRSGGIEQSLSGEGPHEPLLAVTVDQPLLKDGWLTGASLPLTEAKLGSRIQNDLFSDVVNAFVVDVDAAYWDLALAQADLGIKTRSLQRSQSQYDDTRENIRRGILADAEIFIVEESLVIFQQEHLRATQRLRLARRNLAQLLYLQADLDVDAGEALELGPAGVPDRARTVDAALRGNPVLRAQRERVQLARARARFQANQTLPSLALRSSLGVHGSANDYPGGWRDLALQPNVDAEVGLRLEVPLDRAAIDAGYESAALETRREEAELERQANAVRFNVENALTVLETDLALATSAQRQVTLADLKLQAQMEKYKNGASTLQDVVQFQRELDNALINAQRVVRAVRVGQTRLLAQIGTLHDAAGVGVGVDDDLTAVRAAADAEGADDKPAADVIGDDAGKGGR